MMTDDGKQAALEKAIQLFITNERLHRCAFDKKVSCFNIHRSQHRMLMFLSKRDGPVSQKALAKEFEISPAAVAVACKKLEALGYISRAVSANDNRVNDLCLTDKGRAFVCESKRLFNAVDTAMFDGFTADELNTFIAFLQKMQLNLKSM